MRRNNPSKREDIVFRKIGDETVLYSTETRLVHILNSTAERVWQLCDGRHNIAKIEEGLGQEFIIEDEDHVRKDIESILTEFEKNKLLKEVLNEKE